MKLQNIYILLAVAALSSCNDISYAPSEPHGSVTITATISDEKAQSRTCVDTDGKDTDDYLAVKWHQGDQIGVFGDGSTKNARFESKSSGKTAEFKGDMNGDNPKYAYYPYSEDNNDKVYNSLVGNLPEEQPRDKDGKLTGDYKYGEPVEGKTNEFSFTHMFSMLRITVDAAGTNLANEQLEGVMLTFTDSQGKERLVNGKFSFSAIDGSYSNVTEGTNKVSMPWTEKPKLESELTGFVTVMPTVKVGDKIAVEVLTSNHKVTFTASCKVDFEKEYVYNIPLTLANYAAQAQKFDYKETARPTFSSFGFTVANNNGKLLDNQLVWNSSNKPQFNSVSTLNATIDGSNVNLTIPYLYDFTLIPDFSVASGVTVSVNGVTQTSGKTAVDFSTPVTYTLTADGDSREYTVTITNTGLPVVVLTIDHDNGDFSEVKGGSWPSYNIYNKFVDFMIRGKDTDWVDTDQLTIYNADGTVNMATTFCGSRLRGNTSQAYPKKPFALKFVEKQSIFGLPKHKRWVLLANWLDHSMIRNTVAFDVAHAIEGAWKSGAIEEGIPWNVHGQNVELIVDGHHVGNYVLCEQIKIDKNRLNINKCYEDIEAEGTTPTIDNCGFLFELDTNYDEPDKFITEKYSVPFMFKDPVGGTSSGTVFDAVKTRIQGIENNIYNGDYSAAYNDLDINSVIDQWLIWELTMNHEYIDPRSVYYFMNGNGKLSAGPVWDFDRATFQNPTNAQSQGSSGDRVKPYDKWICWSASPKAGLTEKTLTNGTSCVWYPELVNDPIFQQKVQERWAVIYPYLQGVVAKIREYGQSQAVSYTYDSAMWPTTKAAIQAHKSGFSDWSGDENISDYNDVIENFVQCYTNRLNGMNTLISTGKFTK